MDEQFISVLSGVRGSFSPLSLAFSNLMEVIVVDLEKLNALDTLYDRRSYLVENPASTIRAFHPGSVLRPSGVTSLLHL